MRDEDDRMVVFWGLGFAGLGIVHMFSCMFATLPFPYIAANPWGHERAAIGALVTGLIGVVVFGIVAWFTRASKDDFRACVFFALLFFLSGSGSFLYRFLLA